MLSEEVQVGCHLDVCEPLREFLQNTYFGVGERVRAAGSFGHGSA